MNVRMKRADNDTPPWEPFTTSFWRAIINFSALRNVAAINRPRNGTGYHLDYSVCGVYEEGFLDDVSL